MYYAQAAQDQFADVALGNSKTGFFVDVGAACTYFPTGSNSYCFEERGWTGIAIDGDQDPARRNKRGCVSLTRMVGNGEGKIPLGELLAENNCPVIVDYLSIDLDGDDFDAIKSFVESGFTFKVLTFEHDLYSQRPGSERTKWDTLAFLSQHGYIRVVDNVGDRATLASVHTGNAFEDWYINPKYVDYKALQEKLTELRK